MVYTFGPFRLIPEEHLLLRNRDPLQLAPKAWETLLALVEKPGHLVAKDDLLKRVWPETFVEEGSLTKCISQLRKVLDDGTESQNYIQTVPTKGYRFIAQVEVHDGSEGAGSAAGGPEKTVSALATDSLAPAVAGVAEVIQFARPEHATQGPGILPPPSYAPVGGRHFAWLVAAVLLAAAALVYWISTPSPAPMVTEYAQITRDGQEKLASYRYGLPCPILTDGTRLYFMEEAGGGRFVPAEVSASGGESVMMPTSMAGIALLAISPDGTQLLASRLYYERPENPVWMLSTTGLAQRRIPDLVAHDATWTSHGDRIIYADGETLYAADPDGTSIQKLVSVPGIPCWLRCSPDGRVIRFTLVNVDSWENSLWQVSSDGRGLRPLLVGWRTPQGECCGDWTPDGKYYVFQDTQRGQTEIWALREKNSIFRRGAFRPVQLTRGPTDFSDPLPSHDGKSIFAIGEDRRGELVRFDPAIGKFTLFLGGISADHVEFSKDGKWIAYSTYPESVIWRSRPDGSGKLQLSFPPMQAIFPRWSPDGKWLAFIGDLPGEPDKVYLASAQGGSLRPMMTQGFSQFDPNWSPDGNEIMFAAYRPGPEQKASLTGDIEIYNLRTHKLSVLLGSSGLSAPRWSPDGRYVAATAIVNDKWQIPAVRLYDFHTGKWTPFENDPIDNKWWSHDGRYFYFDTFFETAPAIFRESLSSHDVTLVASLKNVRRASDTMGWWMGLTPDDSPMVLRDTSIQEIYSLRLRPP